MNPEIRKFWEKVGELELLATSDEKYSLVICKHKNDFTKVCITSSTYTIYYYNDSEYTEEEMLRLIKIHAFL